MMMMMMMMMMMIMIILILLNKTNNNNNNDIRNDNIFISTCGNYNPCVDYNPCDCVCIVYSCADCFFMLRLELQKFKPVRRKKENANTHTSLDFKTRYLFLTKTTLSWPLQTRKRHAQKQEKDMHTNKKKQISCIYMTMEQI